MKTKIEIEISKNSAIQQEGNVATNYNISFEDISNSNDFDKAREFIGKVQDFID